MNLEAYMKGYMQKSAGPSARDIYTQWGAIGTGVGVGSGLMKGIREGDNYGANIGGSVAMAVPISMIAATVELAIRRASG